ncbi:MAG: shikimate kinase [Cyanobacteria bacterium P01_G01_bin.54]
MNLPILIIGPHYADKSAAGSLLAAQLELPFIPFWQICGQYWQELDIDGSVLDPVWQNDNKDKFDWFYRYMMPFDAYAIERGVVEHPICVMELGSPQSVYDDTELFNQVSQALEACSVVLLLPSEDVEESLQILEEENRDMINGMERNEYFVKDHSNYDLAQYIFYTQEKTPEQTCDEILAQIDLNDSNIILIGPRGAGKSTIGRLLSQKLERPQAAMDQLRFDYYADAGWGPQEQRRTFENEGQEGYYRRWKQFRLPVIERILIEHQNCVIDFGAGHSVFEDSADFDRARGLLAPHANVVLLMPSPDQDDSVAILHQRNTPRINGMEADRFFLTHPSNRELATLVVYTQGKTPPETRDEILQHLKASR